MCLRPVGKGQYALTPPPRDCNISSITENNVQHLGLYDHLDLGVARYFQ